MVCPLLRRGHVDRCRSVEGTGAPVSVALVRGLCQGPFATCPAFRFLLAAGRAVHPADFAAWVLRGVSPGKIDPESARPGASG